MIRRERYYGFEVKTTPRPSKLGLNLLAYHVEGHIEEKVNVEEVAAVKAVLGQLKQHGYSDEGTDIEGSIGVISPYRMQIDAIRRHLASSLPETNRPSKEWLRSSVGTIHTFQGSERQVIVLSTRVCRTSDSTFFINRRPNLLNVAVSRAQELCVLVGNLQKLLSSGGYARQLVEHIEKHGTVLEFASGTAPAGDRLASDLVHNCEHLEALRGAMQTARQDLTIVCPWVRGDAAYDFARQILPTLARGVAVNIIFGYQLWREDHDQDERAIQHLKRTFAPYPKAHIHHLRNASTHEKILLCDDRFAVVGSWNWLSHRYGRYCGARPMVSHLQLRRETSVRITDAVKIANLRQSVATLTQAVDSRSK